MTTEPRLLADLARAVEGDVISAGHPEYDDARKVWNVMHDLRPLAVIRCRDEVDVATAMPILSDAGLSIAIRGGGHHIAGFGTCEGGVVLDLSAMRGVTLDPQRHRARVQGGATLHEADMAADAHDQAIPLGVVSETGVAGLTLGGGLGWLTRLHGYTCDNLVGARVIAPDGSLHIAGLSDDDDLLWGLRGGGGNFGVVTEFEFETKDVGRVFVGDAHHVIRDEQHAAELLRFYRDWSEAQPLELSCAMSIETVLPSHPLAAEGERGKLVCSLMACAIGLGEQTATKTLEPLTRFGDPRLGQVVPMRFAALQHLQDQSGAAAHGMRSYMKGEMLAELTDEAIEGIAHYTHRMPTETSIFEMQQLGGALADEPEGGAAVGLRKARHNAGFQMMAADDDDLEERIAWAREAWTTLAGGSVGGAYSNFNADVDRSRSLRALADAGAEDSPTLRRLAELKRRLDPANSLHINHNIPSATSPAPAR